MKNKTFSRLIFLPVFISSICLSANAYDLSLNGKAFPEMSGKTFLGNSLSIPKDLKGKTTFIALGYDRESNKVSETWVKEFLKKYGKNKNIDFYVLPMLGNGFIIKTVGPILESSLKSKIPKEGQKHVMLVYQSLDPIKKYLSYEDSEKTYFYLIDKNGNISWSTKGKFSKTKLADLSKVMENISD